MELIPRNNETNFRKTFHPVIILHDHCKLIFTNISYTSRRKPTSSDLQACCGWEPSPLRPRTPFYPYLCALPHAGIPQPTWKPPHRVISSASVPNSSIIENKHRQGEVYWEVFPRSLMQIETNFSNSIHTIVFSFGFDSISNFFFKNNSNN